MEFHFIIEGKPAVQKNDLEIRKKKAKGKLVSFVGHSSRLTAIRERMTMEFFRQFKKQGGVNPIDYPIEVNFKFFCAKQHEPDLDNLPQIVLDALQGIKMKGGPKVAVVLENDKLVRKETSEKVLEYDGQPRTEVTIRPY